MSNSNKTGRKPGTSLPPGFTKAKSAVPGIEVYRFTPRPKPSDDHHEVVEFRCPHCDGVTAYSTDDGGLTCSFCGYHEAPQVEVVGKGAQEFEFTAETVERAVNGWGTERKELVCHSCAAHITLSTEMLSHTCPFCGSNAVVQTRAPQDVLRPRFLVPFVTTTEKCRQITAGWLQSSWILPDDLQKLARSAEYTPIFIPFWTFDAHTQARWYAEVLNSDQVRKLHGKMHSEWYSTSNREKSHWEWESGWVNLAIDDMLISGSIHLDLNLLEKIQGYQLNQLVPYDPAFLAGMLAQAYEVDLETAWERARRLMRARTKQVCIAQASSPIMRNFSMKLSFNEEGWRYILLPLYLATYRYGDKVYQVMINGQTGEIAGQRPVNWNKIAKVITGLFLPNLLLAVSALILSANQVAAGKVVGLISVILLLVWLILVSIILRKAGMIAEA